MSSLIFLLITFRFWKIALSNMQQVLSYIHLRVRMFHLCFSSGGHFPPSGKNDFYYPFLKWQKAGFLGFQE